MRMPDFQTQQNYMLKKMLPPNGEGCSTNKNAGIQALLVILYKSAKIEWIELVNIFYKTNVLNLNLE